MPDLRAQLQAALGDRYALQRELSGGGMSRVYVATEAALGRDVVIKVLPPELAAAVSVERFRREILLAARLTHPHIVPVHAAGEVDGLPYFIMPLVEGESLRSRLVRGGALPIDEVMRILRGVASALAHAHGKQVVHRDIKPDNVLLADGEALVTDFGVARALTVSTRGDQTGDRVTTAGVALGTPGYMAPEQSMADPDTDERADIYSFGALAYELLSGQAPFAGRPGSAVLAAQLTETPAPISERRAGVPPALAGLVMRCLERDPTHRVQSASELVHALDAVATPSGERLPAPSTDAPRADAVPHHVAAPSRRVALAVSGVVLALLLVGAAFWRSHATRGAVAATPDVVRIAVLPFENLGDSADGFFTDGLTDAVRGKLTSVRGVEIIAPGSSDQYRRTTKPLRQIGEELGVRYLVVAKVRWQRMAGSPERVQVSPALIEAASAADKWEQPFDAPLTDVFRLQGDIAARIAGALGIALGSTQQRALAAAPTQNLEAYEAYLRGAALDSTANDAPGQIRLALRYRLEAVRLDSTFGAAWAAAALEMAWIYVSATPSQAIADSATQMAARALRCDSTLPAAYAARVLVRRVPGVTSRADREYALAEAEHGLRLAQGNTLLLRLLAELERGSGRWDDAIQHAQEALRLDPRSQSTSLNLSETYLALRRHADARLAIDRTSPIDPLSLQLLEDRMILALAEGKLEAARSVLHSLPPGEQRAALITRVTNYEDLYWVLDDGEQRVLLQRTPADFADDTASWALTLADQYSRRGDSLHTRIYAESAVVAYAASLRDSDYPYSRALYAVALAHLGRRAESERAAEHALSARPIAQDAFSGPTWQFEVVRAYLLLGERERALDALEPLLRTPFYMTPAWLRIDPTFAPLRGEPRFERLAAPP